jgi:pre-mRNA-splicing factor SYF2
MGADTEALHLLDSADNAARGYERAAKDETPFGWDSFNQATLYRAYERRAAAVPYVKADWDAAKAADPNFYRTADAPVLGAARGGEGRTAAEAAGVTEENVAIMRKELMDRERKKVEYSRRRKFNPDAAVLGINSRNDHFVKKLDRFYGQHTKEIRANLERGTALPDK